METNTKLLGQFLENCEVRDLSKRRKQDLKNRLTLVFRELLNKDIKSLTKKDLDKLLIDLRNRYKSYWTLASMIASIKVFVRFVYELESSESLPKEYRDFKVSQKGYKDALYKTCDDIITPDEAFKLVKNTRCRRDAFIFMLMMDCGLRPHELLKAKLKHIEHNGNLNYWYFVVPSGTKTGKRRVRMNFSVPFVQAYLETLGDDKEQVLIPISHQRLGHIIKHISKGKLKPYDLRHSSISFYAPHFVEKELEMRYGTKQLQHYVHLIGKQLDDKMDRALGITEKQETDLERLRPKVCVNCARYNSYSDSQCSNCKKQLDYRQTRKREKLDMIAQASVKKLMICYPKDFQALVQEMGGTIRDL